MVSDLLNILMRNDRLKASANGTSPVSPSIQEALQRIGGSVADTASTLKDNAQEQLDILRGNTYGQVTTGRPLAEAALGIADDTSAASRISGATGLPGASSGDQDTMRHLALQARLQRNHPLIARALGTGHELLGTLGGQDLTEAQRDEANNTLGRKIGENTTSVKQSDQAAYDLASGPMSLRSALPYLPHSNKPLTSIQQAIQRQSVGSL